MVKKNKSGVYVGEALVGGGNEIAHIDLLIGPKSGPVGAAFCNALARQTEGHTSLLAGTPNNITVPNTVTITKVTIKGAKQAVQMFGPAQAAVDAAVKDALAAGDLDGLDDPEELCVIVGVFIHWQAEDDKKIFEFNYEATRLAIRRAVSGTPSADEAKKQAAALGSDQNATHPFIGKFDLGEALPALRAKFPAEVAADADASGDTRR